MADAVAEHLLRYNRRLRRHHHQGKTFAASGSGRRRADRHPRLDEYLRFRRFLRRPRSHAPTRRRPPGPAAGYEVFIATAAMEVPPPSTQRSLLENTSPLSRPSTRLLRRQGHPPRRLPQSTTTRANSAASSAKASSTTPRTTRWSPATAASKTGLEIEELFSEPKRPKINRPGRELLRVKRRPQTPAAPLRPRMAGLPQLSPTPRKEVRKSILQYPHRAPKSKHRLRRGRRGTSTAFNPIARPLHRSNPLRPGSLQLCILAASASTCRSAIASRMLSSCVAASGRKHKNIPRRPHPRKTTVHGTAGESEDRKSRPGVNEATA